MKDIFIFPKNYIKYFSITKALARTMLLLFATFHIIGLLCLLFNTSYTIFLVVFSYWCGIFGVFMMFSKNMFFLSLKADIEQETIVVKSRKKVLREISISDLTSVRVETIVWHWHATRYTGDMDTYGEYICIFMNGNEQIPTFVDDEEIDKMLFSQDFFVMAYREDVYEHLCNLLRIRQMQNQYWESDA